MVTRKQFEDATRAIELLSNCRDAIPQNIPVSCQIRNRALAIIAEFLDPPVPAMDEAPAPCPPGGWPKVAEPTMRECKATSAKPFHPRDLMPDLKWVKFAGPREPKADLLILPGNWVMTKDWEWVVTGVKDGIAQVARQSGKMHYWMEVPVSELARLF